MRRIKKNVKFYINPAYDYNDHKLNILKECLTAWSNQKNKSLQPKFKEFEYRITHKYNNSKEIHVYEVSTTWRWLSQTKLFESVIHLIEDFGEIID